MTRRFWDEFVTLWVFYGFGLVVLLAAGLNALFYFGGHPLWWVLAIFSGLLVFAAGFVLPWTEAR